MMAELQHDLVVFDGLADSLGLFQRSAESLFDVDVLFKVSAREWSSARARSQEWR